MGNVADLIVALNDKYKGSIPLAQIIINKYSLKKNTQDNNALENTKADSQDNIQKNFIPEKEPEQEFILSDNFGENSKFVSKLIAGADELTVGLKLFEGDSIVMKLLENYKNKLETIPENVIADGEKLAKKVIGYIKNTIWKLYDRKNFKIEIEKYLRTNGFSIESFEPGHKLSGDDYSMLEDITFQCYKQKTDDRDKNERVIEMLQPIIRIFYRDSDGDISYECLKGNCKFYAKS